MSTRLDKTAVDKELEQHGVFIKAHIPHKEKVKKQLPNLTEEELNTLERSRGGRERCAMHLVNGCSRFVSKRGSEKCLCWYHFSRLENADKREYESELAETEKELLRTQVLAERDLEDLQAREEEVEELAKILDDEELAKEVDAVRKRISDKMAKIRASQLKAKKSTIKFRETFKESLKRHMDDSTKEQSAPKRQSPPRDNAPSGGEDGSLVDKRKKSNVPAKDPGVGEVIIPSGPVQPTAPLMTYDLIVVPDKQTAPTQTTAPVQPSAPAPKSDSSSDYSGLEGVFTDKAIASYSNAPPDHKEDDGEYDSGDEEVDIDGMDTDSFIDSPNPKISEKPIEPTKVAPELTAKKTRKPRKKTEK
jgi:hypothetical protein